MKRDVVVAALPRNTTKRVVKLSAKPSASPVNDLTWRLERLEGQMQKLSELVRDHAEDMDRLVRIVAENSDILRRQLLRKHHEKVRVRKHLRATDAAIE
ncbi:MAG: hypothetical protein OEY77_13520 [Nitrospira sp.]|nr:hypothetical protein [Nitrospira sp.]